jgi:nucleotide-binding universal stress UspA family protein
MKNILLCTDGSAFSENIYRYGAWFAHQFQSKVNVLLVTDIRTQKITSIGNLSGILGLGASEQLLIELVNLEHEKARLNNQRAKLILNNAAETLKAQAIEEFDLTHKTGFLVDCFHEFEENSDLIILGKRGEAAEFASGHLGANLDRIVRSSRKPCLVTPLGFQPIERILIAYDGSVSGKKILQFLVDSPALQSLEIHLLTIAKSSSDQTAVTRLNEAQQWLEKAGFQPICRFLEGDPENAIAHYVQENNLNLLMMGAYGHNRIRHLVIGSTTLQILRSSNIPVMVFR